MAAGGQGGGADAGRPRLLACLFLHRFLGFRRAEVESLAALAGVPFAPAGAAPGAGGLRWTSPEVGGDAQAPRPLGGVAAETPGAKAYEPDALWGRCANSPLMYIWAPDERAAQALALVVQERSLLVRVLAELWAAGADWAALKADAADRVPPERLLRWATGDSPALSFKIISETFGARRSYPEQMENMRHLCAIVPFAGPVSLHAPDMEFLLLEILSAAEGDNSVRLPGADTAQGWHVGRVLALAQRQGGHGRNGAGQGRGLRQEVITRYSLKTRPYIGPTSMDNELAFLMGNLGHARRGSLVYDPFVGTGSLLVPAAHFGAVTLGADIDIRVVQHGKLAPMKGDPRAEWARPKDGKLDVWSNFRAYGLPLPAGLLRMDAHLSPLRSDLGGLLHAIICDPPYGVRAGGRKSGGRRRNMTPIPEECKEKHIPSTAPYQLSECLLDLLDFAARMLIPGGRLVYFLPSYHGLTNDTEHVPPHPALRRLFVCEQPLQQRYSRKLVVMEKAGPWCKEAARASRAQLTAEGAAFLQLDTLPELIYSQEEARKAKAKAREAAREDAEEGRCGGADTGEGRGGGEGGGGLPRKKKKRGGNRGPEFRNRGKYT